MLIEDGQEIPFDVGAYGFVKYSDKTLGNTLKKEIQSYLNELDKNKNFDSPVLDVLHMPPKYNEILNEIYRLILKIAGEKPESKYDDWIKPKKIYKRILWVDDFPSNNEYVTHLFKSKNIKFDIAKNTERGLELFANNKYDLIITDMGRGSEPNAGLDLIRRIKQQNSTDSTPIVVFSGYEGIEKYGREAQKLGAMATITGFSELITLISQVLGLKE
jgi:CheY-like chemotaxis protein